MLLVSGSCGFPRRMQTPGAPSGPPRPPPCLSHGQHRGEKSEFRLFPALRSQFTPRGQWGIALYSAFPEAALHLALQADLRCYYFGHVLPLAPAPAFLSNRNCSSWRRGGV
ncbi:hypothetical protein KIL84_005550 [Mauremys mutica]|uniref:Uncharacterized protein n=1 Tax=Mauremys mutica TaxID=74926 RepID=A0A9D3WQI8_9SAUR|nr:hypothetical protein KIL84_005550 [Mauremys mutica]